MLLERPSFERPQETLAAGADEDVDLALVVGGNLRRLRTRRGLSLARLAAASAVSRAMLGQIELGHSLPTIGILWKIARAMEVPFAAFTAGSQPTGTSVIRAAEGKVLASRDGTFVSRALFPFGTQRGVEFYELRLAPGAIEDAGAHAAGTMENLVVGSGRVDIDADQQRFRLCAGDAILFAADVPHCYRNPGPEPTVMYLVMIYSSQQPATD